MVLVAARAVVDEAAATARRRLLAPHRRQAEPISRRARRARVRHRAGAIVGRQVAVRGDALRDADAVARHAARSRSASTLRRSVLLVAAAANTIAGPAATPIGSRKKYHVLARARPERTQLRPSTFATPGFVAPPIARAAPSRRRHDVTVTP